MIKFFKKIRQRLLAVNKFGKYLIYAFGEIVLVVIGILIALSVNNYNENQKQETIITETLRLIHRELSEDIRKVNAAIEYYSHKDTLINFIMTHELSRKDFQGKRRMDYVSVGGNRRRVVINTNGFELLMTHSQKIPQKYQGLLEPLKMVYQSGTEALQVSSSHLNKTIEEYLSDLNDKEWHHKQLYFRTLDDDAIDFYLNDPSYKNHLANYHSAAINNYYENLFYLRFDIEDVYDELTDLLALHDVIESDSSYYRYNKEDYLHFQGTYKSSASTAIITMGSDKLLYQYNDKKKEYLIPISKQSFIVKNDGAFNEIKQDSTGRVTHHNWHYGKEKDSLKKIE